MRRPKLQHSSLQWLIRLLANTMVSSCSLLQACTWRPATRGSIRRCCILPWVITHGNGHAIILWFHDALLFVLAPAQGCTGQSRHHHSVRTRLVLSAHTPLTTYSRNAEAGAHVTRWDNFSKLYRVRLADTARALLKDALWTGVAIRQYAGSAPVDMRCTSEATSCRSCLPTLGRR